MLFVQEQTDEWRKENAYITHSSSWDHFFMDGNKYTESYFDPKTGKFMDWRKAFKEGNYSLYYDIVEEGKYPRVIHLTCHKDFIAVRKYYKKKTKNRVVNLTKKG